jgi:putative transposase
VQGPGASQKRPYIEAARNKRFQTYPKHLIFGPMFLRHRPPRLATIFYDPPLYFITICVQRRLSLLATEAVHLAFREFAMRGFEEKQIAMGRYVIMPDHLHLFVSGSQEFHLAQWARMLKLVLGRVVHVAPALHRSTTTAGETASRVSASQQRSAEIWERGFFDHLIRNAESYGQKWKYVRENPVRAGLVVRADDWPYQGEIVEIRHS